QRARRGRLRSDRGPRAAREPCACRARGRPGDGHAAGRDSAGAARRARAPPRLGGRRRADLAPRGLPRRRGPSALRAADDGAGARRPAARARAAGGRVPRAARHRRGPYRADRLHPSGGGLPRGVLRARCAARRARACGLRRYGRDSAGADARGCRADDGAHPPARARLRDRRGSRRCRADGRARHRADDTGQDAAQHRAHPRRDVGPGHAAALRRVTRHRHRDRSRREHRAPAAREARSRLWTDGRRRGGGRDELLRDVRAGAGGIVLPRDRASPRRRRRRAGQARLPGLAEGGARHGPQGQGDEVSGDEPSGGRRGPEGSSAESASARQPAGAERPSAPTKPPAPPRPKAGWRFWTRWWLEIAAVVLLATPLVVLFGAGITWMWQSGWLIWWLLGSASLAILVWTALRIRHRPRRPTAPGERRTSLTQPDPTWAPHEQAAWAAVQRLSADADGSELDSHHALLAAAQRTVEVVAQHYHPDRKEPALEFTVPELLLLTERVSARLRLVLLEHVPLSHRLKV